MNSEFVLQDLRMFWWAFAVRGGLAMIFAVVLFLASSFLGIFFFDPVTLVYLSLLLGSFVLGNGLLQAVASGFAFEHHLHLRWLALCESCFELLLGVYIGISMLMTPQTLAFLAGIHALGNGFFQTAMAARMRKERGCLILTGLASVVSLSVGVLFLTHFNQPARPTTQALSGFELFSGITWLVFAFRLRS
ncbi:MAG TPA: hypothetical protein VFE27_24885 [Acidobacteriaceae bacterium]|jgi:uncharacterized membrane protein HdeD (DUF308 family)|nr:hypothetical protein [Acidobacteriaceae bacterium]